MHVNNNKCTFYNNFTLPLYKVTVARTRKWVCLIPIIYCNLGTCDCFLYNKHHGSMILLPLFGERSPEDGDARDT
jgi:hypothetical protein